MNFYKLVFLCALCPCSVAMLRGRHYGRPVDSQLLAASVLVLSMAYQCCESLRPSVEKTNRWQKKE